MAKRAFVLGASGQLGSAIGERLLKAGWDVTCGQRGEALPHLVRLGARTARVDRSVPGVLKAALGESTDVLIDAVAFDRQHAEQLLELQESVGQFIVISSASVYKDAAGRTLDEAATIEDLPEMPIPIHETQHTVDPGEETYSTRKVALERKLLDESRLPVSVIRPCAIHGRHSKHPREWWFVKRRCDGRRRVPLAGETGVFQTSAAHNVAEVVAVAIETRFHGVLNAGDPSAPSIREIGTIVARALDWEFAFVAVPLDGEHHVGYTPWSGLHPFVLGMDAATRLGYHPATTYAEYAPDVCRWLVEAARDRDWREIFPVLRAYPELFDYAAEDAFFASLAPRR
ncbi:MAG: NAD-dependent epimerase/dehydratase family protein [Vulcanimicrobiaceae bacterium]